MQRVCLWISGIFVFVIWIHLTAGTCTLPFEHSSDLYASASIGTFGANDTHLINYPLTIPLTDFSTSDFECLESREDRYLLKMVKEPNIFNSVTRFFMCIELFKVNNHTFYYYLGTEYHAIAQDYFYGDNTGRVVTFEDVCNRDYPYEKQTFVMLVKTNAFSNGEMTTRCPDDLLSVYLSFNVSKGNAATTNCDGGRFDVCTNRTTISFSYNDSCPAPAKQLSNGGSYSCLFSTNVADTTYVGLWNQDETVDETNTFRYSCFAFNKVGSTIYATETPNICEDTTTATNPGSNGVTYVIWNILETCLDTVPVVPEEPVNLSWLYFTIVGLVSIPIILWIICMAAWCYKKYGCICKKIKMPKFKLPKMKFKKKPSPKIQEIDTSRGEKVGRARFNGPIIRGPEFNVTSLFRSKKPVDDFSALSAIFLEQKPMGILQGPDIRPLYKDTLEDYLSGGIRRSYTQISISDSSIYKEKD